MARRKKLKLRYNEERAERAVAFFNNRLHLTKGRWTGVRFELPEFQADGIIRPIFGSERYDDELGRWVRQYRKAWIELPKKNGKSPIGAGLALQGLVADGEQSPEVYSVAAGKRQAGIVFGTAAQMVTMEPALMKRCELYTSKLAHHGVIYTPKTDGYYRVIPGDATADDGITPSRVIVDEVHRISNREILDLLDESFAAREEPLLVYLTTAGVADETEIAYELHEHALAVRNGTIEDPYFFSFILGATMEETDGDKWKDEALWRRVNPAIDSFNPGMLTDLRTSATAAEVSPAKIANFKRLRLNVWLPSSYTATDRLVDLHAWDLSAGLVDRSSHRDDVLHGGLDMASTEDMAALVGVIPNVDGCPNNKLHDPDELCVDVVAHFWIPKSILKGESATWTKATLPTLRSWVEDGLVTEVDGEVIDDRDIQTIIREWRTEFDFVELAKDPYQSKQIGIELEEEGLDVYDHGQTMERMGEPTKRVLHYVKGRRLHHGGNRVLRWMASNAIARTDTNGNMKPDRKKSSGKIDGIVALIMALASMERELTAEEPELFGLAI